MRPEQVHVRGYPRDMDLLRSLGRRGETLATAESLTGGMLASLIADVPGISRVFMGGVVAYASAAKESVLGVDAALVARHGVVSQECALAMARGVRGTFGATWGVSTTGVAGPDRQEGHDVGTVWIAVAGPENAVARCLALVGDRREIREQTCAEALSLLDATLGQEETGLR